MELAVGDFVGSYRVGCLIIATENSKVYESFHPSMCQKLALKLIPANGPCSPQQIADEVSFLRSISHPNIMSVLDVIFDPAYTAIVMPLATGGDLFDFVLNNGPVREQIACQIVFSMLNCLVYLHGVGICHRDIKLENFLLMDNNYDNPNIFLIDFGYSKRFKPGELMSEYLGTKHYAAPEIHISRPYDESIDIWSLGVTIYSLLSAQAPFSSDNEYETRFCIVNASYNFDDEVWNDISFEAKDLISKMIVRDPKDRIKPSQALQHTWFNNYFPNRNKPALVRTTINKIDPAFDDADDFLTDNILQ